MRCSVMNVMLIDDDKASLITLASFIRKLGHQCDTYNLPRVAAETYKEKHYDLVITDLKMPGMDGFQVLQEVLSVDPKAKVIISTGYIGPEAECAAMEQGIYAFLNKPTDLYKIAVILERVTEEIGGNV